MRWSLLNMETLMGGCDVLSQGHEMIFFSLWEASGLHMHLHSLILV